MADPRFLLATAIDDSAEAPYRIVADIPDPVAKARAALSAVDQIQGHLLRVRLVWSEAPTRVTTSA